MHLLLIGSDSLIARSLERNYKTSVVCRTSRRNRSRGEIYLDLIRYQNTDWSNFQGSKAIICGGVTSIEQCQKDPETSRVINVTNTLRLVSDLNESNISVLFLSSSAVFGSDQLNRSVTDIPIPDTQYGMLKKDAELQVLAKSCNQVVRLTKMFSTDPGSLLYEWRRKLLHNEPITAYGDLLVAPLSQQTVADKLIDIAAECGTGLYHLSTSTSISYYEIAVKLAKYLNKPESLVVRQGVNQDCVYRPKDPRLGVTSGTEVSCQEEIGNIFSDLSLGNV